ncbi:GNAT family N-acetyltransferase [Sphingomonas sp.]|uniref:GNAT family N-acetyltransferase n=1 Tax=Sphingomonas sp. TaxID=28214 RepID=UPI00286DADC6|nr:GNAT family N-acetyltransferase [Sphingomonas sp.]
MTDIVAETARLRLRGWRARDRAEFVRRLNTPAVMRWLGGVQDEAFYVTAFDRIDGYQREFGHTLWIVERIADEALLGFCGLKRVNSPGAGALTREFEVGWRLREDAWGQGFAKEAAIASLDLAFDRFGAEHVVALTVAGNTDSQGLMHRLGMQRREDLDYTDPRFGPELNPTIIYRIDAAEWPAARAAAVA